MRPLAALALVLSLAGLARADALAPSPPSPRPAVRVSRVAGPRTLRAIHARLRQADLAHCQHTFIGGDLIAEVAIDETGRLTVTRARAGEEIRSYAPCVARALGRLALGPARGVTRARVRVRFPSLGLGAPTPASRGLP